MWTKKKIASVSKLRKFSLIFSPPYWIFTSWKNSFFFIFWNENVFNFSADAFVWDERILFSFEIIAKIEKKFVSSVGEFSWRWKSLALLMWKIFIHRKFTEEFSQRKMRKFEIFFRVFSENHFLIHWKFSISQDHFWEQRDDDRTIFSVSIECSFHPFELKLFGKRVQSEFR